MTQGAITPILKFWGLGVVWVMGDKEQRTKKAKTDLKKSRPTQTCWTTSITW